MRRKRRRCSRARALSEANARGLADEELAFYDALGVNDSAVQVLGDETLRDIARELVGTVRGNLTIDWTLRENVRANLRRLVKRVLRKHGYPPDKRESATRMVLEQAEVLSSGRAAVDWSAVTSGTQGTQMRRGCRLSTNAEQERHLE